LKKIQVTELLLKQLHVINGEVLVETWSGIDFTATCTMKMMNTSQTPNDSEKEPNVMLISGAFMESQMGLSFFLFLLDMAGRKNI
jgi:hypothetical protein